MRNHVSLLQLQGRSKHGVITIALLPLTLKVKGFDVMGMELYRTSDFVTAAVLVLLRHTVLHVDRTEGQRVVFEFERAPQLEEDLGRLDRRELRVDPLEFWMAERRCKRLLYESAERPRPAQELGNAQKMPHSRILSDV